MDELLRQLNQFPDDLTAGQNVIPAAFAIILSFLLSMPVVYTYRQTHQGTSYSQAYAQTLV